jgi:hypothetical protein
VQGLIFFKGLNDVVVLGNGLERDKLVVNADVDEMRKLATNDKLPVIEKPAALDTFLPNLLPAWWYIAAFALACWLIRLLIFKREKGQVYSRLRVFLTAIPGAIAAIIKASGQKPSRFWLYILIALVAVNALAFGLKLYQDKNVYDLPSEAASALHIQPWQISRGLDTHPEAFQRVTIVPELNTVYAVLDSKSIVTPKTHTTSAMILRLMIRPLPALKHQ